MTPYLLSVPAEHRLEIQGLSAWRLQGFLTVAGMAAVIVSVLAGAAAGLLAAVLSDHALAASLIIGSVFAAAVMALMPYQAAAWRRTDQAPGHP